MNRSLTARIMDLLQRRQLKGILGKVALALSCMAIFLITYLLVAPVLTQEWETTCGMEEHTHTESCYEDVLACGLEETGDGTGTETAGHTHSDSCYEVRTEDVLVCGQEEGEGGHTHGGSCYTGGETVLTCTEPEGGHTHTDSCYTEGEPILTCTESTGGGHTHSDSCYTVETVPVYKTVTEDIVETYTVEDTETRDVTDEEGNVVGSETVVTGSHEETRVVGTREVQVEDGTEEIRTLTCGEAESSGHEHTGSCYTAGERVLTCTEPEGGHTHSESCYAAEGGTLTCTEEESPGHVHDSSCYEQREVKVLVCTEGEPQGHVHSDACYERRLTCGLEEHTHTDLCYQRPETPAPAYICGFLTEHTHGEDCYFESGELKCTIPEHTHDESCLAPQKPAAGWTGFPETLPEGYVEAQVFQPEAAMFAMIDEEDGGETAGETGIEALVYVPADAFEEAAIFVPVPLFEDDEAYAAAAGALALAGAEYDSMTAMDLSFIGTDSYEPLEPNTANGPVYVRLTMPAEEPPEDAELTLWHHTADGAEEIVESSFRYEDGTLTVDFAADSFSTYAITTSAAPEEGSTPVSWGTTNPLVDPSGADGVTTWNVSGTQYRYLDIPVSVNVASLKQGTTITLPYTLKLGEAGRSGYSPTYKEQGSTGDGWSVAADQEAGTVTITINKETGGHNSIDIYYRFDCWNVVSGSEFEITCSVKNGQAADKNYNLKGKIITGLDGTLIDYANNSTESPYSFDGFGKTDKKEAYILAWNEVYKTYFDLEKDQFHNDQYIYDIAAFEVQPDGQQPYNISGTITPDQHGEVLGGVYMMDSAKKPDDCCVKFQVNANNSFAVNYSELKNKVVSSLSDPTDHGTYTLYFLVRYPRETLEGTNDIVKLNATLNLQHTGVDSSEVKPITGDAATFCCYSGNKDSAARIYWASYYSTTVNSSAGLTMLSEGKTATVEYSADFFCLNEARADYDSANPSTYRLEAIIDLSYLSSNKSRLAEDDYRFSGFNLSLIDAPGNWSQSTSEGRPNVGWTQDRYNSTNGNADGVIKVYGSISLTGNSWKQIGDDIQAASVWAQDSDRAFVTGYTNVEGNYARLKVVYESKYTTALRVGYRMELQPNGTNKLKETAGEELKLTNWVNYLAYVGTTDNFDPQMNFDRYPVADTEGVIDWNDASTLGTINDARIHDETCEYPGYTGKGDNYSHRVFARTTLGRSTDVAGMVVSQILYDSDGEVVGTHTNKNYADLNPNDSYSQEKEVVNVSEIVYSISGIVTNGASSYEDLEQRQSQAGNDSPYRSMIQKYYVLLPEGLRLNTTPEGLHDESDDSYLSASSLFYKNSDDGSYVNPKAVDGGETDVPVSAVNVPGLSTDRGDGKLSDMLWYADGIVTCVNTEMVGNQQLVIFERTIDEPWVAGCPIWPAWLPGASATYFWGRGLSFSVVPANGTGSLPAGSYTPQFWCQFLDGNGNPISLNEFARDEVENNPLNQNDATLLHIPSTFVNKHHEGGSDGEIEVEIDKDSVIELEDGTEAVKPEGNYSYPLTYKVEQGSSTDVVLWCNVEAMSGHFGESIKSEWQGTVAGVNLNDNAGVKVYVRPNTFEASKYEGKADRSWLTDNEHGWNLVVDPSTYPDWSTVEAIAFSFEDKTFKKDESATVYINMTAPKDDGLTIGGNQKEPDKTVYTAYNELLVSDTHKRDDNDNGESACYFANYVAVPMKVTPVSYVLPSTGGSGMAVLCAAGTALVFAAACLMYQTLRRGRKTGEGGTA